MRNRTLTLLFTVFSIFSTRTFAQCDACDSYLSGVSSSAITIPAGQVWCINNVGFAHSNTMDVNGILRLCGASADFQQSATMNVNVTGVIDVQDCPARLTWSGFSNAFADPSIMYDCDLEATCARLAPPSFNGGTGNRVPQCNPALPVLFGQLSALQIPSSVAIQWTTLQEVNNEFFEIQSSVNAIDFYTIGSVASNGNSVEELHYSYEDVPATSETRYYRIRQIDFDGNFDFSPIVSVQNDLFGDLKIFPNPAQDRLTINTQYDDDASSIEETTFRIYDILNQPTGLTIANIGLGVFQADISRLSPGSYFIGITTAQGVKHYPFMKKQ